MLIRRPLECKFVAALALGLWLAPLRYLLPHYVDSVDVAGESN